MEKAVIIGWVLSTLGAVPLILGGVINFLKLPVAVKNTEHVGFPLDVVRAFGVTKVSIAILSLVPATALIGVILATGWMGGAIAAHVRVKERYFIQIIIPIAIWVGFGLRHQTAMHSLLGF